jgi:hypothetical protein
VTTFQVSGTVAARSRVRNADATRVYANDVIGRMMMYVLAEVEKKLSPVPSRASLYPGGEVAWDECDCNGQLWVRLQTVLPAGLGQQQAGGQIQPCGVPAWAAQIGVGIIRCVASIDDSGEPPDPVQLTQDTLQASADRQIIMETMGCIVRPNLEKLVVMNWLPLGPMGGCAGGEWTFQVQVTNCMCP